MIKRHRFGSHTPEEMRRLSDLGHRVEGLLLAAVGILAILNSVVTAAWMAMAWPLLILVAGVLLLVLIYPTHPLGDWPAIWRDAQQGQHTIVAAVAALAGAVELLRRGRLGGAIWAYVWPVALLVIGLLFFTHTQHGEAEAAARAVRQHRILGITLIAAGLLRAVEVATAERIVGFLWPLALLVAAAQLLFYHEPEGAFEPEGMHGHHSAKHG